jgi:hypothetical protein
VAALRPALPFPYVVRTRPDTLFAILIHPISPPLAAGRQTQVHRNPARLSNGFTHFGQLRRDTEVSLTSTNFHLTPASTGKGTGPAPLGS